MGVSWSGFGWDGEGLALTASASTHPAVRLGCCALDFLPQEASVYMGMNNEVVLSVRCVSNLVRAIMASLLVGSIFTYGYFKPSPPVVV